MIVSFLVAGQSGAIWCYRKVKYRLRYFIGANIAHKNHLANEFWENVSKTICFPFRHYRFIGTPGKSLVKGVVSEHGHPE